VRGKGLQMVCVQVMESPATISIRAVDLGWDEWKTEVDWGGPRRKNGFQETLLCIVLFCLAAQQWRPSVLKPS